MKKSVKGNMVFVDAEPGKCLVEPGKEDSPQLIHAIFIGDTNIPEYEEKPVEK